MGSGGGGSSSGHVSHSAYLESIHGEWLNNAGADHSLYSITDVINALYGNSPWTSLVAYDPAAPIAAWEATLDAFAAVLAGISYTTDWASFHQQAIVSIGAAPNIATPAAALITAAQADDEIVAYGDLLDDRIDANVLPRFRRGMQDINSVVTSAFAIGEAIIEAFNNRDLAKYAADVRLSVVNKNADIGIENARIQLDANKANASVSSTYADLYVRASEQMLRLMLQTIAFEEGYAKLSVESNRIKIVALKEQTDMDAKIDVEDSLWDISLFQYGGNLIASIGGGTLVPDSKKPTTAQSVIGGALSGAAAGTMLGGGPGVGTAVGAVLGAAAGLL
jgi:hypothetical protein